MTSPLQPGAVIRPATAADLPRIVAAADTVFRNPPPPGLGSMGHDYPLLFEPSNAGHLMIAEAERSHEILAHAGFVLRDARLDGTTVRVATFGAVFTLEGQRERGLATRVLTAAVAEARAAGAELGLVSGKRGLYERAGFGPYPACPRFRVRASAEDAAEDGVGNGVRVVRYRPDALADLMAIAARERVHFIRSRDDWRRLLDARVLFFEPAETFLVERGGRAVAYLAVGLPTRAEADTQPGQGARVLELGGDRAAIGAAAPLLARVLGTPAVDLVLPPGDHSLDELGRAHSWRADEVRMPFTAAWWNPEHARLPLPFYGFNYV